MSLRSTYEHEYTIVAWLVNNPKEFRELAGLLAQHFRDEALRRVFLAARAMAEHGPVDTLELSRELDAREELESIGGEKFLAEVWDANPFLADPALSARGLMIARLREEQQRIHVRAAEEGPSTETTLSLQEFERQIEALEDPTTDETDERFSDEATSIRFVFESRPPQRRLLIENLMPAEETALLVARGGSGKGHLICFLALRLAMAHSFGAFRIPGAVGSVIVTAEEDSGELHRRLWAALELLAGELHEPRWRELWADILEKRIRFVSTRGLTDCHLGPALRDRICRVAERVDGHGMTFLDPLGRFVQAGITINSQEGAAAIINEQDAIRHATSAAVLAAYHCNKNALDNAELEAGASSGSLQLEDLSRLVVNMAAIKSDKHGGLEPGASYVEVKITKTNYTPPLVSPLVFERGAGGALVHVVDVGAKTKDEETIALTVLLRANCWIDREEWRSLCKATDLSLKATDRARKHLENNGSVRRVILQSGRRRTELFGPPDSDMPPEWPPPPPSYEQWAEDRSHDEGQA